MVKSWLRSTVPPGKLPSSRAVTRYRPSPSASLLVIVVVYSYSEAAPVRQPRMASSPSRASPSSMTVASGAKSATIPSTLRSASSSK
jgi:hypothetical protein